MSLVVLRSFSLLVGHCREEGGPVGCMLWYGALQSQRLA